MNQKIKNIYQNTNYARLFWKTTTILALIGIGILAILWKVEAYGRQMDATIF